MAKKKAQRRAVKGKARRAAPKRPPARAKAARTRKDDGTLRLRSTTPGLTVNDLGRSLAWYCDVLGCAVEDRWEQDGVLIGAELVAGDVRIALMQDDWQKGRDRAKGAGFRIYCTTGQDVDRLAAAIQSRGGALDSEPRDGWGVRSFGLSDPDGFKITISRPLKR
jgi:uncharacterized glyoxalase superfamily protein PhnB